MTRRKAPPAVSTEWPDRPRVSLAVLVEERRRSRERWPECTGAFEGFTCDSCGHARCCALAFDPYNTNGDCLYLK